MGNAHRSEFGLIFDADNHFWETSEAFTRHRDPKFKDRGLRLVERDGVMRYVIGDQIHPILPGPGDMHGRPVPGCLYDFFAGKEANDPRKPELWSHQPKDHPEYYNRDARLKVMDEQGIAATWMFPTHGVCIEGPMQPDIDAALNIIGGFNRWIEEEWGFAYKDRIFGVPLLSLSDPDLAVSELEWALERGARVITIRNGPAFTRDGNRSPADRMFDPFWARVEEAGITVTAHAGFDDGYGPVDKAVAGVWNLTHATGTGHILDSGVGSPDTHLLAMLQKKRLVHDFCAVMISHGLFERFPRLRFAVIENGAYWVGGLLHDLQVLHAQNPGMYGMNPVDQFHRNFWIAPFVEDSVEELAKHVPIDRILFGSDWPHAEGVAHPRDFFANLTGFSEADQRKIMRENAEVLTYA